ncbi:MAG: tetratricopeptide repeat protein [Spirochaetaceae bacterium]|jgi:tetratricopeptide (TPR) repeat protein|nr:tetratricopeptide repeat protein [Spirochaetaceae bacterium]
MTRRNAFYGTRGQHRALFPSFLSFLFFLFFPFFLSCAYRSGAVSAEEYYTIGMAYFDMGRYDDAEKWLGRARDTDKTMTASEYNLGRIAFERGRYDEALRYFERVLAKDPRNVTALKAAAYTQIKRKDFAASETLYNKVLELSPENADDGYNYALVLYIMEQYERSEEVVSRYSVVLPENSGLLLLLARTQRALHKPEAINRYAQWLEEKSDPAVRAEYAAALEEHGFYARALEEYRSVLKDLKDGDQPKKKDLRFAVARLTLTADPESGEGMTDLAEAVAEGFDDREALEKLAAAVSGEREEEIRRIIAELAAKAPAEQETTEP